MKFMSWKWIVKTDDFVHWYKGAERASQEVCVRPPPPPPPLEPGMEGYVEPTKEETATGGGNQMCETCPTFLKFGGQKDPESQTQLESAAPDDPNNQVKQDEQLILNHLRSNPSLLPSTASVASVDAGKRGDSPSTGSKTQAESLDEDENEKNPEKKRYSKRILLGSGFAVCLVVLLIVLVSFLAAERRAFRLGQVPSGGVANATAENSTTLTDSESETENHVYTIDGQGNSTYSVNDEKEDGPGKDKPDDSDEIEAFDYTANTDYLVGVYYYPWYNEDFHKGAGYVRRNLNPPQMPVLGEYDDSKNETIEQHMKWFRQANIGLLVTSWWGPYSREDNTTKNVIMEHEDIGNLKIALHFETKGRIQNRTDMSVPREDIQYMCENYFDHDNYYKIDGRPVIVVHVTRLLHNQGILEEAILTMRSEANKCNQNLYIIGDQVFDAAPGLDEQYTPFWFFDAVTNFDVYGSAGRPNRYMGAQEVDWYYGNQSEWKEAALLENCQYIPPVTPGYNDRGVRLEDDHPAMSRRLTADAEEGSLFWYQLRQALELVSPEVDNLILVNSFNEFHEDTQIEPVMSASPAGTVSFLPPIMTGGLEYAAYGELYLDLLGAATSKDLDMQYMFDELYVFGPSIGGEMSF